MKCIVMVKAFSNPCHCINVRRAANALTAHYDRMLAPCGLSIGQFSLLWNLDTLDESNVTRLAECLALERSTVVRNLKPLIAEGYVRDGAGDSRRDRRLTVTAKGKAALTQGISLWKQAQKNIHHALGIENIAAFRDMIGRLQQV